MAVKETIVFEKNGKGGSTCHRETVVIHVDGRNGAESIPQNGIPTLWLCKYTKSHRSLRMRQPIPGVTPDLQMIALY